METLYARTVPAAVDALYRVILSDDRLSPYFAGVDIGHLKQHMTALLTQVLGGPSAYAGRDLRTAHARLAVTAADYDLVGAYLIGVLAGLGADDDLLASVRAVLAATAPDIVH
ncbi:group 1 truncated hemoglobin [Actinoplanes sp. OR16]|uniref:group I truncated hemoglobin n=1 Tax=Actinoplanes sp. OR16 TaxID=946334 RepID=UPI000FD7D66C|nr:group 1 truncated hemoglobin [Actinoplanes sp. OR16]